MIAKFSNIDGKVYVNNVEITDIESWEKVIDSIIELQQENQQLKEEIEHSIGIVEHNKKINEHILKEREFQIQISAREEVCMKLENNWNELKEWVNRYYDYYMNSEDFIGGRLCFADIKNKMQELEKGKSE